MAVYTGKSEATIVPNPSDVAAAVELHETRVQDNVMRMQPVPQILIPAGGQVELKRGGLHVMMMGLKRNLAVGDRFAATLQFQRAGALTVEVTVRDPRWAMRGGRMMRHQTRAVTARAKPGLWLAVSLLLAVALSGCGLPGTGGGGESSQASDGAGDGGERKVRISWPLVELPDGRIIYPICH